MTSRWNIKRTSTRSKGHKQGTSWCRNCCGVPRFVVRCNLQGYERYWYPHFLDWGVPYPTFQDEKVNNLQSSAVSRSDLRRLNYNKTVFCRGFAPDPTGKFMMLFQTPESNDEGILPPHSPLLSPRDPRVPRSPSESVPPLFRPKLCSVCRYMAVGCCCVGYRQGLRLTASHSW